MINRTTGAPAPTVDIHEPAGTTRGAFLLKSVMATGAAYGAVGVGPVVSRALAAGGGGDIAIAQFALLLEHLETAFYEQAGKLKLSGDAKKIAAEFGAQEAAHRTAPASELAARPGRVATNWWRSPNPR